MAFHLHLRPVPVNGEDRNRRSDGVFLLLLAVGFIAHVHRDRSLGLAGPGGNHAGLVLLLLVGIEGEVVGGDVAPDAFVVHKGPALAGGEDPQDLARRYLVHHQALAVLLGVQLRVAVLLDDRDHLVFRRLSLPPQGDGVHEDLLPVQGDHAAAQAHVRHGDFQLVALGVGIERRRVGAVDRCRLGHALSD